MKVEKRAIENVTNFRDSCKRAAEQMGWDLKDTSYAVWDFTLSALEKQIEYEKLGYSLDQLQEILKMAEACVRDSRPFETDKIFIDVDDLRRAMGIK